MRIQFAGNVVKNPLTGKEIKTYSIADIRVAGKEGEISSIDVERLIDILENGYEITNFVHGNER